MKVEESPDSPVIRNRFARYIVLWCGFLFAFLALLGAILPMLPTTPFLIAAAACFHRSSPRFYLWIMNNRYFGRYLQDYKDGKGIHVRVKIVALLFLWVSSLISVIFFIPYTWLKVLVVSIMLAVSVHIYLIRTKRGD
ncbi:MAG: YbaN family protein [Bacteroidales bacterium]